MPRWAIALLGLGCLAGCGSDLSEVTGTVEYNGKPLPRGVIWFDPAPDHPDRPPQGFAYITDGKFTSMENGRGVRSGAYTVRVEGFDGKPGNELPLGKPLFTKFQTKQDLPAGSKIELNLIVPKK